MHRISARRRSGGTAPCSIVLEDKEPVKPRIQDVVALLFEISPEQAILFRIKRTGLYERASGRPGLSPLALA